MRCSLSKYGLYVFLLCLCTSRVFSQTTIGWRHDGSGSFPNAIPPTEWSLEKNIVWKTAMPGKCYGSPIVINDRVYIGSDPAELLCLNINDGTIVWRSTNSAAEVLGEDKAQAMWDKFNSLKDEKSSINRKYNDLKRTNPDNETELEKLREHRTEVEGKIKDFQRTNPVVGHLGTGNVVATPVSDGKSIFVSFGTGIVASYDLDGNRNWIKFLEPSTISFGHTSSPVITKNRLIVHYQDLVALNPQTGGEIWRTEINAKHASPILVNVHNRALVIVPDGSIVDPIDGEILITDKDLRVSEGSVIINGSTIYSLGNKTTAFELKQSGNELELVKLWQKTSSKGRRLPSPVLHHGLIYAVTTEGILEVIDAKDGESVYKERLNLKDQIYSSVTAAGDYIYINSRRQGHNLVFKAGRKYEEVARNSLEATGSNPVFIDKRMYLRTDKHLFCVGE